jgi:hypothetical protein
VTANIETLLIALYVFCDDHVIGRRRIGRPPLLPDAELLCLAIAQVLLGFPGERHWIRYARKNLRHLFLTPSQAERRLLRLWQWIEAIFDTLKGQLSLEQHGSRTRHGICARVGQRLLAMAACIWHNTNLLPAAALLRPCGSGACKHGQLEGD